MVLMRAFVANPANVAITRFFCLFFTQKFTQKNRILAEFWQKFCLKNWPLEALIWTSNVTEKLIAVENVSLFSEQPTTDPVQTIFGKIGFLSSAKKLRSDAAETSDLESRQTMEALLGKMEALFHLFVR